MKRLKKPTAAQRKLIEEYKLTAGNWLVERDTSDMLVLVHRYAGEKRTLYK